MSRPSVLLVEDDPAARESLADILHLAGFSPRLAASLAEARLILSIAPPDVVLADVLLPDGLGSQLLEPESVTMVPPVVLMSGYCDDERVLDQGRRSCALFCKPLELSPLLKMLRRKVGLEGAVAA